ncbi:unnamed protein product [Rotaria magnacalcarata]|uniref:Uncharacterized protein n=1 Tax=Rotaria magnacalcarata TaxID=392030 RepID=A0A816BRB9_9BILA|nr:unnamed protein product [Rotaria magnacalcarata]CAF1614106.1 unnamed protein product [Rotaria magnacalcarata]CAF2081780.1 unnamed protein product [Rotaria magnacalcarata]CAF2126668.1 unnamed protein product [Rotaria magnacalcarata]CAF2138904.1 unnamed protein product [Rotaria magnacalcarata]
MSQLIYEFTAIFVVIIHIHSNSSADTSYSHQDAENMSDTLFNNTINWTTLAPIEKGASKTMKIISICLLVGMVVSSIIYWKSVQQCKTVKPVQQQKSMDSGTEQEQWERF